MNVREKAREVNKSLRRYVTSRLSTGQLKVGDQLPTEREFVEMLGGSRTTVRRALDSLEKEGLIGREVGRGTFVKHASVPSSVLLADTSATSSQFDLTRIARLASPHDVMELRILLEPAVVEQAVIRANVEDIEAMDNCLEQAQRSDTLEEFEHWDDVLHRSIATASRNPLFEAVYSMVSSVRLESQWGEMKRRTLTEEAKAKTRAEHQRIVDAIRHRDSVAAQREMQAHIESIRRVLYKLDSEH